jgi:DNA-binding NtrC family response regulator
MSETNVNAPVGSRVRALVVDDEEPLRRLLQVILVGAGFDVVLAANGREATRLLESEGVGVVITDVFMPEEDGIELVESVRRRWPRLPVVVMSGGSARHDPATIRAAALGADAILQKPFDRDDLLAAIGRVLDAAR